MELKKQVTFMLVAVLLLATALYLQSSQITDTETEKVTDGILSAKTYIAAYNEPDKDKRAAMFNQSFHEEGMVLTPTRELDKAGLEEMASDFHKDYLMEVIGEVDSHHNFLSFRWKYSENKGTESWSGMDYCEFGEDGRLTKVVIFYD